MPFFHCNSTPLEPGAVIKYGNWGRIIRNFGYAHNLAFREAVFEYVRSLEFPAKPSRLDCSFFFSDEQTTRLYLQMDPGRSGTLIPYEVELVDLTAPQHTADWRASTDPVGNVDLEWVKDYWRGVMRPSPAEPLQCREYLAKTDLRIVRRA